MQRLRSGLGGVIAVLGAVLVVAAATWSGAPWRLDIGTSTPAALIGLYRSETMAENWLGVRDTTFQWSNGASELVVARSVAGRALLELTLADTRPGTAATDVTVTIDGRRHELTVARGSYRRYELLMPAGDWTAPLRIGLMSATEPSPNGEPYGVAVFSVQVRPVSGVLLPGIWLIGWAAVGGLGLWLLAAGLVRGRGRAAVLTGVLLVWGGLLLTQPAAVSPYLSRLSGLLLAAAAAVWTARRVQQITADGASALTIVLGVTPWLMVPAHWLIVRSAQPVTVPVELMTWTALVTLTGAGLLLGLTGLSAERRQQLLVALVGVAAAVSLGFGLNMAFADNAYDFMAHWEGLQRLRAGGRLYDLAALRHNHFAAVFKIPPFYTALYLPLAALTAEQALLIWRCFNLGLALTAAWLLWPLVQGRTWRTAVSTLLVLFSLRPLMDSVAYGQTDLLLLALTALLLRLWRAGRSGAAGALLGLAGAIKLYPLLLVLWMLRRRDWRALVGVAIGLIAATVVSLSVLGWPVHRSFVLQVLPLIGGTTNWIENQTISGVVARLSGDIIKLRPFAQQPYVQIGLLLSAGVVGLTAWVQQPSRAWTSSAAALELGAWTILFSLAAPAAWLHYHTQLILPLAALIGTSDRHPLGARAQALVGLGWMLIAYGNHRSFAGGPTTELLDLIGMSGRFVGQLLLLAVVLRQLRAAAAEA